MLLILNSPFFHLHKNNGHLHNHSKCNDLWQDQCNKLLQGCLNFLSKNNECLLHKRVWVSLMNLNKTLMTKLFLLLKIKAKFRIMMIVLFQEGPEIWKNNQLKQNLLMQKVKKKLNLSSSSLVTKQLENYSLKTGQIEFNLWSK